MLSVLNVAIIHIDLYMKYLIIFSGPLTSYDAKLDRYYVQGVASFGAPNCDYPNVYARVSSACQWIKCIINEKPNCHEINETSTCD